MPTDEQLSAAQRLREVAPVILELMPASAVTTAFLRDLGRVVYALEHGEIMVACKRCGTHFSYLVEHWSVPPRHCGPCRQQRRREREDAMRAGLPAERF
jgi:hypothetical protein